MKKIVFLLTVAVLAAADVSDLSEEVFAAVSSTSSPIVTLLKTKVSCLNKQLQVCEALLTTSCQHSVYKDCKDAYDKGQRSSGVYTLNPDQQGTFQAYCDMQTDGGGWTVLQRRKDGSVNFYRNWNDYVSGFGDLTGEHWLGLEKIYRLTKAQRNNLRVELRDFSGSHVYAKYSSFRLGSAGTKYTLYVSGYSGTARDSLSYHNGMKFTTKDKDNDRTGTGNCAVSARGAWWYKGCYQSTLNSLYSSVRRTGSQYLNWYRWKNRYESLKFTEMKVRRQ